MRQTENPGIRMLVAAHKPYAFPEERMYLPVQAGAALHDRLPIQGDDTGEEISRKNGQLCELTVLYWGWKNLSASSLGLCHYRRFFREPGAKAPATEETLCRLLEKAPVVLPKRRHYWIETGESQFIHAHGSESLETLRTVMKETCPAFLPAFNRSLSRRAGHRFNMLVMRREQLDAYCSWLFPLLFLTEERLENPPPRLMGFLAERLLDAWIETTGTPFQELGVYHTERTNWLKKGGAFLMRKFRGGAGRRA